MPYADARVPDFSLSSYWTNQSGSIVSGPTKDIASYVFSIEGIPPGVEIISAILTGSVSSPLVSAHVLTINDAPIQPGEQSIPLEPTATGIGDYTVQFAFQSRGNASLSDGQHIDRVNCSDFLLTVTYSEDEPEPEPEPEVDWPGIKPISVFAPGATQFNNNGLAVLSPLDGRLRAVAGGAYEITMRHPITDDGKWQYLIPGAIVRVPVPAERIDNAFIGIDVDLYRTNASAPLREEPSEPEVINYPTFDAAWYPPYTVGSKVTQYNKNYQLIKNYTTTYAPTPNNYPDYWKEIPRYTSGAAVLIQLTVGQDLYFIEDAGNGWYKMSTPMGIEGYIKSSQVTFIRHITPEESQERIITDQLFRIKESTIDTEKMEVNLYAEHVSYDLAAILIKDVSLSQVSPSMAISRTVDGLMMKYRGQIATNLTTEENGTYTGSLNGKNGIFAFLDPDKGIVHSFDAKFTRDNWDIFVLKKTDTDRGFRLRYGKNVRGITWKRSSEKLITCVVPVAKDAQGNDLYLPEQFVDSPLINDYPVVMMDRLAVKGQVGKDDGSGNAWTTETLYEEMRAKAEEQFSVQHADVIYEEITVDFEQLGDTAEHAALKDLEQVLLYDLVTAEDERVGLQTQLTVSEIEWDYIRRKITAVKLTTNSDYGLKTVAGYNIDNNSIGTEKLTEAAITEIANLLN